MMGAELEINRQRQGRGRGPGAKATLHKGKAAWDTRSSDLLGMAGVPLLWDVRMGRSQGHTGDGLFTLQTGEQLLCVP